MEHMKKLLLLLPLLALLSGCGTVKDLTAKGVNVVASVGTNALNLLDIAQPLVQDPAQPADANAVVVNPAIVAAAQGAATTFGGPYGIPIAGVIGLAAGIAGMIATEKRRKSAGGK